MERHSTDMVSLIFGLLFTAVAVVGLTDLIDLSSADVRWIAPVVLVLFGVLLVLPIGRGKQRADEPTDEPTDELGHPATVDAEPAGPEPADAEPADHTDVEDTDAEDIDAEDTDVEDR